MTYRAHATELLARCNAGDDAAWAELYACLAGLARRVLTYNHWHFTPEELEDLAQDVFMKLRGVLHKHDGQTPLAALVTVTAKSVAIDAFRRKAAAKRDPGQTPLSLDQLPDDHPALATRDDDSDPQETAIRHEEVREVQRALAGVDGHCRRVLTMRYFDDLSYRQIAEAFGTTVGTVASWLSRCLKRVRKRLFAAHPDLDIHPARGATTDKPNARHPRP